MANRNLTTKDILQKEFKTAMRGYSPAEVDEFLDNVNWFRKIKDVFLIKQRFNFYCCVLIVGFLFIPDCFRLCFWKFTFVYSNL